MPFATLAKQASTLLLMLAGHALAAKNGYCPPLGPVIPAPNTPSSHEDVKASVEALTEQFKLFTGTFKSTAVSIGVSSIHEDEPILDLHFTPEDLDPRGVDEVDSDTVYRVGSISKVFTVLGALKSSGVQMDDPVTKYLPQLRKLEEQQNVNNQITTVDWDRVSIQALASHMSGITLDMTDLATFPLEWEELGLPKAEDVLKCAGYEDLPACQDKDFWDNFGKRLPASAPWTSPKYSNIAFSLISLVVEKVSGKSFEEFLQTNVFEVGGMTRTTSKKPDDSTGAISKSDTSWDMKQGFMYPGGGFYSSTNDLLAFGKSILENEQLCQEDASKWLKPVSFTSGIGLFAGAPWEIVRSDNVTSDKRLVEFYTKGGSLGTYHSLFGIVPDYGLVMSIMTGGPESAGAFAQVLASQIIQSLVPAVEAAGMAEAEKTFGGKYVDKETNSTLVLEVDDEGPGLNIKEWNIRGTDVPTHWMEYLPIAAPGGGPENKPTARLYPTNLSVKEEKSTQTAWRAVIDFRTPEEIAEAGSMMFFPDSTCISWNLVDMLAYEFRGLDEMVFTVEDGKAVGVDMVGFQAVLKKEN